MEKLLSMSDVRDLIKFRCGCKSDPTRPIRTKLKKLQDERGIEVLIKVNKYYYTTMTKLKRLLPEMFECSEEKDRELYALKSENIRLRRQLVKISAQLRNQKPQLM
jgi:hypothetical protein